jgi:hypothetical protein
MHDEIEARLASALDTERQCHGKGGVFQFGR